jgi:hypothetical protein
LKRFQRRPRDKRVTIIGIFNENLTLSGAII